MQSFAQGSGPPSPECGGVSSGRAHGRGSIGLGKEPEQGSWLLKEKAKWEGLLKEKDGYYKVCGVKAMI